MHYFSRSYRFEQAVHFFQPLAATLSCCAEQLAAAQQALGLLPDAILTIGRALDMAPTSVELLLAQAELLLECHMHEAAARVASHATRLGPLHRRAWLLLCRARLAQGRRTAALRTLNSMPIHMLRASQPSGACPLPLGASDEEAVRRAVTAEEASAVLASDVGGRDSAQAVAVRAAYGVLAEQAQALGWERLLQLRREAFVMEGDEASDADERMPTEGAGDAISQCELNGAAMAEHGLGSVGPGGGEADGGSNDGDVASESGGDALGGTQAAAAGPTAAPLRSHGGVVGGGSGDSSRKPLCHAWLDALFGQLHADLTSLAAWRVEDEHDVRMGAGSAEHERWLTRAKLAERLRIPMQARAAYTRTVQALEELLDGNETEAPAEGALRSTAEEQWRESCTTLMRLHAAADDEGGSVTEALAAAHRLLDEDSSHQTALRPAAADAPVAPRPVMECVYQLVATNGLQHVRAAQRAIGEAHPALNLIFHEVVERKVHGYDR